MLHARLTGCFVFNRGSIVMDGTPAEVFTRSEELIDIGLTVPKVTMVANRLRSLGLPVKKDIYTIEQLRQDLNRIRGGRHD